MGERIEPYCSGVSTQPLPLAATIQCMFPRQLAIPSYRAHTHTHRITHIPDQTVQAHGFAHAILSGQQANYLLHARLPNPQGAAAVQSGSWQRCNGNSTSVKTSLPNMLSHWLEPEARHNAQDDAELLASRPHVHTPPMPAALEKSTPVPFLPPSVSPMPVIACPTPLQAQQLQAACGWEPVI